MDDPTAKVMLHEVDAMRRSVAIGGELTRGDVDAVLDTCAALLAERVRIERALGRLGPAWGNAREALNELSKIVRPQSR